MAIDYWRCLATRLGESTTQTRGEILGGNHYEPRTTGHEGKCILNVGGKHVGSADTCTRSSSNVLDFKMDPEQIDLAYYTPKSYLFHHCTISMIQSVSSRHCVCFVKDHCFCCCCSYYPAEGSVAWEESA